MAQWNATLSSKLKANFRLQVANRFGFNEWKEVRCQKCKQIACEENGIEIHHIFACVEYPELKLEIDNVAPLCRICHDYFHKEYDRRLGLHLLKLASLEDLQSFLDIKATDTLVAE